MASIMTFTYDSTPILTINNEIKNKGKQGSINLQPSYQRGFVWNNDFKNKLIYSIIRRFPIGNITLRTNDKGIREVVDGQQRLTTINNFVSNDFVVTGDLAKKSIKFIQQYLSTDEDDEKLLKLSKKLKNKTGAKFRYSNLPKTIQDNISAYNISLTNISSARDDEIKEYFRFLQNQERLRAGEIINSFPTTTLESYLNKISNLGVFLDKIGFKSNQRHEFDKHFYSIIGLLSDDINYGVTDKSVIRFALKAKKPLDNENLIDNMIQNINYIINDNKIYENSISSSNVRSTKYLLLLLAFNFIDVKNNEIKKMKNLSLLNEKFSVFNSAKYNEVEKAFRNYDPKVIEDFRNITLVSKGSHRLNDVKQNMKLLGYYIENFNYEKTVPYK